MVGMLFWVKDAGSTGNNFDLVRGSRLTGPFLVSYAHQNEADYKNCNN